MIKKNLIFDLGFHNGDDSDFYLKKGFKVIAIEANPELVAGGVKRFEHDIAKGKLVLINQAISKEKSKQKFYIHRNKSDWSSLDRRLAEIDGSKSKEVFVETLSFHELCGKFGTPLYIKVDIEGQDVFVAKQLYGLKEKPQYISFEISKQTYAEIFSWLYVSGYKKFQLINQLKHPERMPDRNQKETDGEKIEYQFTKYSSGFFGRDLPKDKWLSFDETLARYVKYRDLKILDNQELALGWLDIHASL